MDPNGLLDMDEHDEDLLQHATLGRGLHRPAELAPGIPDPECMPDPPKIRVVVRTRPINGKHPLKFGTFISRKLTAPSELNLRDYSGLCFAHAQDLSSLEIEKGDDDIVEVDMSNGSLIVNEPRQKVDLTKYTERHKFIFDDALDSTVPNDAIYSYTVKPLVHTIFKLGKATCFAYGQTGSGKTFTMSPLPPLAAAEILTLLRTPTYSDLALFVSCFEIYGGKVYDLLNGRKRLEVREDARKRVNVVWLKEFHVEDQELVEQLIKHSAEARCTGITGANAESSRSHSIMQFSLKKPKRESGEPGGREVGRLSFIDLAGSERGADTFDNDRQTRIEGAEINKSLLALKECIRALDGDARHVPFRGSKLTEVLKDSFIGAQARTVMIANVSPGSSSVEHTLNTLRYADRVKELRKDKAQRSSGSVTPGMNPAYHAAAAIARQEAEARQALAAPAPPAPAAAPPPAVTNAARQPFVPRPPANAQAPDPQANSSHTGQPLREITQQVSAIPAAEPAPAYLSENDELMSERDDLMNRILEEEDELIQCHRRQIEDTMDIVRSEMNLLAEVDQPGSAIDTYVDKLGLILRSKAASIQQLQAKLDSFKAKLRQEEILSRTMGQKRSAR